MTGLAAAITAKIGTPTDLIIGTLVGINATNGNQVDVTVRGATITGLGALDSYTSRAAGDVVAILSYGSTWLVLGSISSTPTTIAYVTSPSNSAAIGTTRTSVLLAPATYPNGLAFQVAFGWGVQLSVLGGRADFTIWQNSQSAQIGEFGVIIPGAAGVNVSANGAGTIFVNTSGEDITDTVSLDLVESGTAGTATLVGTATRPSYLWITVAGPASDFPNAPSLIGP